ncbi:MAG: uL15 family ribosomal protein [Candidatus Marsarchaeota archaeon]
MRRKPTNPEIIASIAALYASGKGMMKTIAEELEKGSATRVCVDVGKLAKLYGDHKGVAIPGKVLGWGEAAIPMNVAAVSFSRSAREKIEKSGGRCYSLHELASLEGAPSGWLLVK